MLAHLGRRRRRRPGRRHVGCQAGSAGVVPPIGDQDLADSGVLRDHRFDFPQLDAETADLDLMIDPAQESEVAIRLVMREVTGTVQALARPARERIGNEPLRGQPRTVEVAPGKPAAADVNLPGDTHRQPVQVAVQQVDLEVGERLPYRACAAGGILPAQRAVGDVDGPSR